MNAAKALIAGMLQNPAVIKSFIEDPLALGRLAGLGEPELRAVGDLVRGALNGCSHQGGQNATASDATPLRTNGGGSRTGQGVAIASIVSLLAVTGAVVVVGTVSVVALTSRNHEQVS